jgi:manganese/zinc/iron transport system substrate-binding protein
MNRFIIKTIPVGPNKYLKLVFIMGFLLVIGACKYQPEKWQEERLVVTTTGMLGDAIRNILPNKYNVYHLMNAGVDPHSYEAKPSDIEQLALAETIVFNGLHLEGKMVELFEKLKKEKMVYAFSDGLDDKLIIEAGPGSNDPHIWLDPFLWAEGVAALGKQLAKNYPEDAAEIIKNAQEYAQTIRTTGEWMRKEINGIPRDKRVLITSHDAFSYFGRQFEMEVDALQGISSVSEPGIRTVSSLTKKIISRKIVAVFIESSVSSKSIQALMEACSRKNYTLREGGTLYSDAMGDKASNAETYIKMLERNTEILVKGLK